MELFEAVPASIFTLLTSKNRQIYAEALLITKKAFTHDVMVDKNTLINTMSSSLQQVLLDLDTSEEEGFTQDDIKDVRSRAVSIVRKLKETGWIETEFARGSRIDEYVTLPPYSVKMLELLYSLCSEEVAEYETFMYSMYSSLSSADIEYKDYRYTALNSVHDKLQQFELTLKGLFTDLKRHYTKMTHLKTVNQMLYEHFDSYQKDLIKQIYLPLKTKDSISRFKGPILDILTKWLRDNETLEGIISQAMVSHHFASRDDASDDVIGKINFITDKLMNLQELLESIDERNTAYVQAATDKMRFLLRNDKSMKGKISKITEKIAAETADNNMEGIEILTNNICLTKAVSLEENSLYTRANQEKEYEDNPVEINIFDEAMANQALDDFSNKVESKNQYSYHSVIQFMHQQLDDLNRISTSDMEIKDASMLIMLMYSFIRGFDDHVFYKVELRDGNIINNDYSIPDLDFVRKKGV